MTTSGQPSRSNASRSCGSSTKSARSRIAIRSKRGYDQPSEPGDRAAFHAVKDQRENTTPTAAKTQDESAIGDGVPDERREAFEPPLRPFTRLRCGNTGGSLELLPCLVAKEAEQVARPLVVHEHEQCADRDGQRHERGAVLITRRYHFRSTGRAEPVADARAGRARRSPPPREEHFEREDDEREQDRERERSSDHAASGSVVSTAPAGRRRPGVGDIRDHLRRAERLELRRVRLASGRIRTPDPGAISGTLTANTRSG